MVRPGRLVILECKLSQTENAALQINELYRPLIEFIHPEAFVQGVQVCKNLWEEPTKPIGRLSDILVLDDPGVFTWHFLGY